MKITYSDIGQSYRVGFVEIFRHWKTLLPGSAAFYLPELLALGGMDWLLQPLVANLFKAVVMIVLIALALKATAVPGEVDHHGSDLSYSIQFFVGDIAFWGLLLALEAPIAWYSYQTIQGIDWSGPLPGFWQLAAAVSLKDVGLFLLGSLPMGFMFLRLNFFGFILRRHGGNFLQAWASCWKMTGPHLIPLIVFYLIMLLLLVAGLAAFTVGILFTFPVTLLATARLYRLVEAASPV